jgi:hypothetical protein
VLSAVRGWIVVDVELRQVTGNTRSRGRQSDHAQKVFRFAIARLDGQVSQKPWSSELGRRIDVRNEKAKMASNSKLDVDHPAADAEAPIQKTSSGIQKGNRSWHD